MTRWQRLATLTVTVSLALIGLLLQTSVVQSAVAKMTKEELRAKLDSPDVVIVDVRLGKDWKASEEKIKGPFVWSPEDRKFSRQVSQRQNPGLVLCVTG